MRKKGDTNNKTLFIFTRIILLLFIPLLFTYLIFYFIIPKPFFSLDLINLQGQTLDETNTNLKTFIDQTIAKQKVVNSIIKLPDEITNYHIYANNNIYLKIEGSDPKEFNSPARLIVESPYKRIEIKFREMRRITNKPIAPEEFYSSIQNLHYLIYPLDKQSVKINPGDSFRVKYLTDKHYINFNIWPSWVTFIVYYVAILIISFGLYLTVNGFWKFIIYGIPSWTVKTKNKEEKTR